MPSNSMLTDVVSLIKANGQRYDNIKASVQPQMIFINDSTLPIEEGDKIVRDLPNGLIETYIVLDRGFYQKFHAIAAHYQVKVRKETAISSSQNSNPSTIIGNLFTGDQINVSNVRQSAITIKSRIENVSQNIGHFSYGSVSEKNELQNLIANLNDALKQVSSEKEQESAKLLKRVEILLAEMSEEQPDKDKIEITGESLLMAAKNLAVVMPTVLPIATQIVNVVMKMLPQ